jgi:hypothetical protein
MVEKKYGQIIAEREPTMPIQFTCSCGRKLQAKDEHAGRTVRCPDCGAESTVPAADAVQPTPAAPKPSPVQAPESRRAGQDDDRPARRSRVDDEEDEDRPRRRSRGRDDDDDEDDDRRRPSRRPRSREDDDDDYDRPREPAGTSGKASAALVLGLLSFCLGLLAGIPAVILGILALADVSRSRGRLGGKGLAIAGLLCGVLGTLSSGAWLYFSVFKVRDAAARIQSGNNLKMISLATINYADTNGGTMPGPICDKDGKPLLSWRVAILPYIEQDTLYRQFRLDEPWDGPNNKRLIAQMPKVYAHPKDPEAAAQGLTYYRVFTGPNTPFPDPQPPFPPGRSPCLYPMSFVDGTSNTILVAEAADPVVWTKPDELPYVRGGPLPRLGGKFSSGYNVVLADGSLHVVSPGVSEGTLRSAIDINDGQFLGPDW